MTTQLNLKRKNWIDWMKTLGMLLIVWGHFFPPELCAFIYSFSVPTFFIISGYLTKREATFKICWQKSLHNLIIPYIIISLIKDLGFIIKHISDGEFIWSPIGILAGFHTLNGAPGCGNLWFVYTLLILKFTFQLCGVKKTSLFIMALISVIGTIIYNQFDLDILWAATNALPSMLYFLLGYLFSSYLKPSFDALFTRLKQTHPAIILIGILYIISLIYTLSAYNQTAWMFRGEYGNYINVFYLLGVLGAFCIFLISILLDSVHSKACIIISTGTIVILGFHRDLNHPFQDLLEWLNITSNIGLDIGTFIGATIVLIAFVPIILIVKKIFPVVLGKRSFT